MRTTFASLAFILTLTACGGGGGSESNSYPSAPPPSPVMTMDQAKGGGELAEFQNVRDLSAPGDDAQQQYIAYTHNLGMRLPSDAVEPLMQSHIELCRSAGTAECLVTNSNLNNQSDEHTSGWLRIKASKDWIDEFMQGVDGEADEAGGEIINRQTSAEDLTRLIIDTDARLNAQITLKGRLEDLLATREGELADLLEIERELARVIGQVESITSNLKALQQRVSMQDLTVSYEPKISPIAGQRFNPLSDAFGNFFSNLSSGLAGVINFFALGLPWMFLIGAMLFIWLRMIWPWARKRRSNKA